MTPLASWALIAIVAVWGVYLAVVIARYLDDQEWREWEADVEQWKNMCDELDMEDLDETEDHD